MKYKIVWQVSEFKEEEIEASDFNEAQAIWAEAMGDDGLLVSIEDEKGMRLEYGYQEKII